MITVNENDDKLEFETNENISVTPSFDAMNLNEKLLRGIYAYGFEKPSAIQQRAIVPIIRGRDVIAQAQSGTGKVRGQPVIVFFSSSVFTICLFLVCYVFCRRIAVCRHENTRMSSVVAVADSRVGCSITESVAGFRRLYECASTCLHRRQKCRRRHPKVGQWRAHCVGHAWPSV